VFLRSPLANSSARRCNGVSIRVPSASLRKIASRTVGKLPSIARPWVISAMSVHGTIRLPHTYITRTASSDT
jgi:hypothetical protein